MDILFIRHGKAKGNLEKRYIGVTDEPLSADGIYEVAKNDYPSADIVVTSGMKRCIETAGIIYPNTEIFIDSRLNECDFGDFEGKNHYELNGSANYQNWIDSNGEMPFPNGESLQHFKKRCVAAFDDTIRRFSDKNSMAFIVHGGTIMAILEAYCDNGKKYFDFMCDNANGYTCTWEEKKCANIHSLL
ncbi:2,3-bisphosphoglycerate-dependent phosphoglycerate mutase [bioreactor metagenome]|uniref:phosphoglycerate mutase (2,3-diphosphoglycerate-dependent) n=1 Tax=bioreactor metagenome TaxID=1076179 RepID=A0A645DC10_9ZZZZ